MVHAPHNAETKDYTCVADEDCNVTFRYIIDGIDLACSVLQGDSKVLLYARDERQNVSLLPLQEKKFEPATPRSQILISIAATPHFSTLKHKNKIPYTPHTPHPPLNTKLKFT